MENAVKDLFQLDNAVKQEKLVHKSDYKIVFYAVAAFLIGGAAALGLFFPSTGAFCLAAAMVLAITYLISKAFVNWEAERSTDLDQTKKVLENGKHSFQVLSEIYGRNVHKKNVVETDELKTFFKQINEDICSRCYLKTNCWEIYTGRTEQYIKQLLKAAENGEDAFEENVDRMHGFQCDNRLTMALYTKSMWKQAELDFKWKKKMESSKESLAAQFQGTAEVFGQALREVESRNVSKKERNIKDVFIGISKYAKDGVICGDSCAGTQIDDNKYLFLLSDGMGSGKKAATESMITINTLYQFLKAGYDPDISLSAMNSILVLKSTDEIFATVDMATLDLTNGILDFYKAGSAAAFIKREDFVEVIKEGSLPMGIVNKTKTENVERKIRSKDMILMVSDGIVDAGMDEQEEEYWLEGFLSEIKSTDPQTVADLVMSKAMERYGEKEKDDMCAMVIMAC